jgi:hypothetical protein
MQCRARTGAGNAPPCQLQAPGHASSRSAAAYTRTSIATCSTAHTAHQIGKARITEEKEAEKENRMQAVEEDEKGQVGHEAPPPSALTITPMELSTTAVL